MARTDLKATAVGSGFFRVLVNGAEVSKHTAEREATEEAFEQKLNDPTAKVEYVHDYRVTIEITSEQPAPEPDPGNEYPTHPGSPPVEEQAPRPPATSFHEPEGFTPLVIRPFNTKAADNGDRGAGDFPSKVGGSEGWDGVESLPQCGAANMVIVAAPDEPLSGGSAMRIWYRKGLVGGDGPAVAQTNGLGGQRDLYVRASVRLGPTYQVGAISNKLYFHRQDETSSRGEPFLALFSGGPGKFNLGANFQGTPDNGLGFFMGTGASLERGRWYVIETLLQMSSGPDKRDGAFHAWVDGELVIERSNVAYYRAGGSGTFDTLHVSPTFGGGGGMSTVPEDMYFELGHVHVSGRRVA